MQALASMETPRRSFWPELVKKFYSIFAPCSVRGGMQRKLREVKWIECGKYQTSYPMSEKGHESSDFNGAAKAQTFATMEFWNFGQNEQSLGPNPNYPWREGWNILIFMYVTLNIGEKRIPPCQSTLARPLQSHRKLEERQGPSANE